MKRCLFLALLLAAPQLLPAETLITWKRVQLTDKFFAEGANAGDINKDGKTDIISGPFWYEGPDWQKKHAYYEPKEFSIVGYSDNFFCYARDFNADGWQDILVLGFPGKEARLYLSPGSFAEDKPWEMHIVADVVDNESPVFEDITGDGKPEIVCGSGGKYGWYAPNWDQPTEKWPFVAATADLKVARFTHGMGVGDVNGDGKPDLLEARRWWEQGPANEFKQHNFAAGVGGGAQMFAYDFDGDGRNDVATALAAHRYGVAVFMNRAGKEGAQWERKLLVGEQPWENDYGIVFSQPHAMHLADVDGDGIKDLVTGKRYWAHNGKGDQDEGNARVLYWFKTRRDGKGGVEFVPHLIDADSGVGVDVQVADVNDDKFPDVIVGNKGGAFILLQERREVSAEVAKLMEPKKMYGAGLMAQKEYKSGQPALEALKNLQLPTGFKAELIAAEPDVVQPIAMCWDERGRIWVVEGNSYPKPREAGAGQDRVLILEDVDGNGSFETKKVFAEGLNLVSGIEVGFGGVWVGAAPYLMFIPDKNRDDKPDAEEVASPVPGLKFNAQILLDGWGAQDTHETLNSFIWGPDGWLYGCHGVFTHSKVGKPGAAEEQRTALNAGVWRYHPVRHVFEVFAHGTSNPWGLDYDQNGEFFVTACVIPHLYHIVPGGRYQRQGGQHFNPHTYEDIKTIADHAHYAGDIRDNAHWGARKEGGVVADDTNQAGGGHAHCGLAIYQSSQFPSTYRNHLIFGNLHGHRLVVNYLDPKFSTYIGKHGSDFMRANDMHFVPVTQKVGPDGSLYVSDWSDKQVCHRGSNAVELWDRSNGRIYRVSYGDRKPAARYVFPPLQPNVWDLKESLEIEAPFDLSKEDNATLLMLALQSDNDWFSRMARRVMMERHAAKPDEMLVMGGYAQGLSDYCLHEDMPVAVRQRAMWLSHQIGQWHDGMSLQLVEKSTQPNVKARAIRTTAEYIGKQKFNSVIEEDFVQSAGKDPSPIVRREYAALLQVLPVELRLVLAQALLKRGEDKDDPYIPLLIWYGVEPLVGSDAKVGLELAKLSKIPKVTEFIYRRLGAEDEGRMALLNIAAETPDAAQRETLVKTVVEAARAGNRVVQPENWQEIKGKLGSDPEVLELEAFMGVEGSLAMYRSKLASDLPAGEREAALRILLQVRDPQAAALLQQIIRSDDKVLTRRAVQALATLPDQGTPALLLEKYADFDGATKSDAINSLATTAAGAKALLLAVKTGKIERGSLSPFVARQVDTLKDPEVKALLKEVWGDMNAPKADLAERKQKFRGILTKQALAKADVAKGRMIFGATCGTCHRLMGEGQDVGPDLTGSNRGNLDYLLDNVLDPNAVIGKDYQLNIFELKDGRLTSGVIKEDNAAAYRVVMPGGIEQIVKKDEVKKRTLSPVSTMPEGLFDALPQDMLLQLVAYLQSGAAAVDSGAADGTAVAGAIEGEGLEVKASVGQVRPQAMGGFKAGRWSGSKHLWWTGGKPGSKLSIRFTTKKEGKQKVFAALTKAPDYGIVQLTVNGKSTAIGDIDLYDPGVVNTPELFLGEFDLTAGEQTLEVTIAGRNPKAKPAHMFALDYLRVE
ncbi:MAG TPA: PVC-type heme-binding CxxCH protein [Prosthecobacter sp.]|nr:PVC-type heme-binding CxxCH protein [Prosthecobacter sp.]